MPERYKGLSEQEVVKRLPDSVQEYLSMLGVARNEAMPMASRVEANIKQVRLLTDMKTEEMEGLMTYIYWVNANKKTIPSGNALLSEDQPARARQKLG